MLQKGTQEYRRAGEIANELQRLSNKDRLNDNSLFEITSNQLGSVLLSVVKLDIFASQVAKTIESKMSPYSQKVAYMSSKQAWIIACAIVENNIAFE
jgi:hypothetical protein